jgi:hypothetical protein
MELSSILKIYFPKVLCELILEYRTSGKICITRNSCHAGRILYIDKNINCYFRDDIIYIINVEKSSTMLSLGCNFSSNNIQIHKQNLLDIYYLDNCILSYKTSIDFNTNTTLFRCDLKKVIEIPKNIWESKYYVKLYQNNLYLFYKINNILYVTVESLINDMKKKEYSLGYMKCKYEHIFTFVDDYIYVYSFYINSDIYIYTICDFRLVRKIKLNDFFVHKMIKRSLNDDVSIKNIYKLKFDDNYIKGVLEKSYKDNAYIKKERLSSYHNLSSYAIIKNNLFIKKIRKIRDYVIITNDHDIYYLYFVIIRQTNCPDCGYPLLIKFNSMTGKPESISISSPDLSDFNFYKAERLLSDLIIFRCRDLCYEISF